MRFTSTTHYLNTFIFTCANLLICIYGFAQNSGTLVSSSLHYNSPFTVIQYSTKHGLPQNQVIDIIPIPDSTIIVSTAYGVVSFNGEKFKHFIDNDEYKKNIYLKLYWADSIKALYGKATSFEIFQLHPTFKKTEFTALYQNNNKVYGINKFGQISILNSLSHSNQIIHDTKINNAKGFIKLQNYFLIFTEDKLYRYNNSSKTSHVICKGEYINLKEDPFSKNVFLISKRSVEVIDETNKKEMFFNLNDHESKNIGLIEDVIYNKNGKHLISTNVGLFLKMTNNEIVAFNKSNYLPSQYINSSFYSPEEDCLFLGTGDKGLLKLTPKQCFSYITEHGLYENASLNSVVQNSNQDIVVCSNFNFLYKMSNDIFTKTCFKDVFYASTSIIDDTIYCGTWGKGLLVFDKEYNFISNNQSENSFQELHIHGIYKDAKANLWIGTSKGVSRGKSYKDLAPFKTEEIKGKIITFYERKDKSICIGGSEGVYILDDSMNIITHLGYEEGLRGKEVRSFYEDEESKLWIGTYDGGLYCYHKGVLTSINSKPNCQLDMDAFTLAKGPFGNLITSSNRGLWSISEKSLNDFYYNRTNYLVPYKYDEESGLVNTELNGGFHNNYLRTKDSLFYFPSIEGLVKFVPKKMTFRKLKPLISEILIDDKKCNLVDTTFAYANRTIKIDFSCVSYISKYNVHYQYKLDKDGEETAWGKLDKEQSVTFKDLNSGDYIFKVRAIDAFNDREPLEQHYSFTITAPYYQTWWFTFILGLTLLFIVILSTNYIIKRKRQKIIKIESQKRQIAQLELIAIQSQMNPHFIFNCLNSLKHLISTNNTKVSDLFLDNFSVLLRKYIEYSDRTFITIAEKTVLTKTYLQLEQFRSNPEFSYTISLEKDIEKALIPTFVIQPFVENAIKHGILHNSKSGIISIDFITENDSIICTITDNGIGRSKSQEINKKYNFHTSKGLSLIEDKFSSLRDLYNYNISFTIEDLYDNNQNALGTKIKILIPIRYDKSNYNRG